MRAERVDAAGVSEAHAAAALAGAALRERPAPELWEALGAALELLRSPGSEVRWRWEAALPRVTGFSPEVVRSGLGSALEPWSAGAFRALCEDELGDGIRGASTTAVVLGGALPMPTLLALLGPLALASGVVARPGRHDPVTAGFVVEALAAVDPGLAQAVQLVSFDRADDAALARLVDAECVSATGSDAAVTAIGGRLDARVRWLPHGHRVSVAVVSADASDADLEALVRDTCAWDQLGCLSPIAAFVLGAARVPDDVLEGIANAFARLSKSLPRGRIPAEEAVAWSAARDTAEMRAAASDVALRAADDGTWAITAEPDAVLRSDPRYRFLRLHPLPEVADLGPALAPLAGHLAAVGLGELARDEVPAVAAARGAGASRACPLGTMQAPELGWRRDHRTVLSSLAPTA